MDENIGGNAGKLWQVLHSKGPQTPTALAKTLSLKAPEVDRAIGWLAREGKLQFEQAKTGGVKISLKEPA